MVRPATTLGPIGLILPTLVQDTAPAWVTVPDRTERPPDLAGEPPQAPDDAAGPVAGLAETCRGAERLGANALWVCDHLFWHGPCLECMMALAVAATATDRVFLGTCVMQLPLRRAPAVAKQVASLQSLAGDRVVLGVGVGSHPGEYEQAGIDYHTRGRQLDTGIAELRRSWGSGTTAPGQAAGGTGPSRYRQLPASPPVPVWVGGSSEAALRRAAGLADGWMPLFLSPAEYGQALERLAKETKRAGRADDAVVPSIVLFVSIDEDAAAARGRGTGWMSSLYGIPAKAFDRHLVSGSAAQVAGAVAAYRTAGAQHVAVYVTTDEPLDQFARLMSALPAAGVPTRGPRG